MCWFFMVVSVALSVPSRVVFCVFSSVFSSGFDVSTFYCFCVCCLVVLSVVNFFAFFHVHQFFLSSNPILRL